MKKDISSPADVQTLVDRFYDKVVRDEVIGHFFTEVVPLDLAHHLPIMYRFWESILLGNHSYQGNPMQKHLQLSRLSPLNEVHFDRWLSLWIETADEHFAGEKANEAKARARHIAALMLHKVQATSS